MTPFFFGGGGADDAVALKLRAHQVCVFAYIYAPVFFFN
jgi:hypothetical protein